MPQYRGTAIYNRYCTGGAIARPVVPAAPVYDPSKSWIARTVVATGEFHLIKKDGRSFSAEDLRTVPFEFGDTMLTGPTGRVQVLLPDQTVFTIGPQSEMQIDEFVFDPATSTVDAMAIGLTKGTFRFITGKIAAHREPRVKIAVGTVGVRGTDVEFEQSPDGTGSVKLYAGLAELTPYDTDTTIVIHPGQMITWTDFTKMSGPSPIQ